MKIVTVILAAALAAGAGPAQAAAGADPDWPCIQRRQPHLSLGQIWPGPPPDDAVRALSADPAIAALAARVEQRRMPLPDAEAAIADFAKTASDAQLAALMVAIFEQIDPHRTALIAGIARYGRGQVALAEKIRAGRDAMAALQAASPPDFDRIDAAETALEWNMRIFTDRQQALGYVCETPVLLEQRAFALGRAIAAHLDGRPTGSPAPLP